jgi:hypothetical protein
MIFWSKPDKTKRKKKFVYMALVTQQKLGDKSKTKNSTRLYTAQPQGQQVLMLTL